MVYYRKCLTDPDAMPFDPRLLEDTGCGVVLTSNRVPCDSFYIRHTNGPCVRSYYVSIVICTYGRPESLNETLASLAKQTFRDFEVLLITEKGNLSGLRQKGLENATGDIVAFIDDDVYCERTWLESVAQAFKENPKILGVTGPTTITDAHRKNRDIFKFRFLRAIQDRLFLGNLRFIPSRLSACGCPSMASNDPDLEINTPLKVDYLEACNMSVKRKEALNAGGFDSIYVGTGEWCELDLAKKIGLEGTLLFVPEARVFHRPSVQGIYGARLRTAHRWENFKSFQRRWIRPSFLRHLYWIWVWTYLKMKDLRMI